MLRLCYNNPSVKLLKRSDGTYSVSGVYPQDVENVQHMIQLTGSYNITFAKSLIGCYESLKNNQSDFSYGQFLLYDPTDTYYIPVQTFSASPYFISGYEVKSYIESKQSSAQATSEYGLMENILNYDLSVHCLILVILIILAAIYSLKGKVRKWALKCRRIKRRPKSRFIKFIFMVNFFFTSTPFLLMFKTSQVVTEKPKVLETYQMIMDANASIRTSGLYTNVTMTLEPNGEMSNKENDLNYKMYNYFIHHQYRGTSPGKNKNYYGSLYEIARSIINNTMVYLDTYHTVRTMRLVFCTLSKEDEYYRTFIFQDVHAKAILAGQAFRCGFKNKHLEKRLRNIFEAGSTTVWSKMHPPPIGFKFRGNSTGEHRKAQLEYCMDEELKAYQRQETFASELNFFASFFILILSLDVIFLIVFLTEVVYFKYSHY